MQDNTALRIAVVGLGPRGLGALEALADQILCNGRRIRIDVFDPSPCPGAGPNFAPDEPTHCLLNIPFRDIAIRPPEDSQVGAFADWLGEAVDPDAFPPRATLGRYLEARLQDLRSRLAAADVALTVIANEAVQLSGAPEGWQLEAGGDLYGPYKEVLLAPGQPKVAADTQLGEWQAHAKAIGAVMVPAYPAREFTAAASAWHGKRMAIRGLGLSTFDVLRGLTVAQGGRFDGGRYLPSGREPASILPFSLDGRPPYPKPESRALDARFAPTDVETEGFDSALRRSLTAGGEDAAGAISEALLRPVSRILAQEVGPAEIAAWLALEWDDPGAQVNDDAPTILRHGIDMASGQAAPDIGYTLGQVWRKWQDNWRAGFNPAQLSAACAKRLNDFDEGLKRYSYGPPIAAARELLALTDAGVVDLSCVRDPEVTPTSSGWELQSTRATAEVTVMVDAVLPAPDLDRLCDPLLVGLRRQALLRPLGPALAAATAADGSLLTAEGECVPGLCALGRLALGSVTAVDSLHDCFGRSALRWAEGLCRRQAL